MTFDNCNPANDAQASARPIDAVLARLDGVAPAGRDQWRAYSPFQERRKTRSLSIREAEDGRVLLHDFGGADAREVLAAIGLEISDLFPDKPNAGSPIRHRRSPRPRLAARDALDLLNAETGAVLIAACDLRDGKRLSAADHERLVAAAQRISAICAEAAR